MTFSVGPRRRQLLDRLDARHGQSLGELGDGRGMSRQTVTEHLAVPAAANLVTGAPSWRTSNDRPSYTVVSRQIARYSWGSARAPSIVANLETLLETGDIRPQPVG